MSNWSKLIWKNLIFTTHIPSDGCVILIHTERLLLPMGLEYLCQCLQQGPSGRLKILNRASDLDISWQPLGPASADMVFRKPAASVGKIWEKLHQVARVIGIPVNFWEYWRMANFSGKPIDFSRFRHSHVWYASSQNSTLQQSKWNCGALLVTLVTPPRQCAVG